MLSGLNNTDQTTKTSNSANTTPTLSGVNAEKTTTTLNCLIPVAGLPGVFINKCTTLLIILSIHTVYCTKIHKMLYTSLVLVQYT